MNPFSNYDYAYIEFYVGMAKMVAYWHVKALGFELAGYCGPETGCNDKVSYLMEKNGVVLVITSASTPANYEVLSFVDRHGNGVKRIAYQVDNVEQAFEHALQNGGIPLTEPRQEKDVHGSVSEAAIKLFDSTELVFFDNSSYHGLFRPGFSNLEIMGFTPEFDNGFVAIDHIAYGLRKNQMDYWCGYFQKIFGGQLLQHLKPGHIITRYSGMLLKLLGSDNQRVFNVFVEPDNRQRSSQVEDYINAYYGSGIQHMAFSTANIFETIDAMRKGGVDFVRFPQTYYDQMHKNAEIPKDIIEQCETHHVLCDVQDNAFLFQTFTKPFGDRPTFFYEVIQRTNGYQGFALDNILELFKSVEAEQKRRDLAAGDT